MNNLTENNKDLRLDLPNQANCVGCMACVDICPKNALQSEIKKDGHLYWKFDSSACVNCGQCTKICPVLAFNNDSNPVHPPFEFSAAAWTSDKEIRKRSSSGGAFASIAKSFIEKRHGVVWGVAQNGFRAQYQCITKSNDIVKLQGSKYQQADMTGVYKTIKQQLLEGKDVLFSGLPCQCNAIMSFFADQSFHDKLFVVDVICGGVPSLIPTQLFMKRFKNKSCGIVSYRNKNHGWKNKNMIFELSVWNKEKTEIMNAGCNNAITQGYTNYFRRESCFRCLFAVRNRKSDVTIGDFWGITLYQDEHHDGISAVIAHTDRGMNLLENADLILKQCSFEDILKGNPRLLTGSKRMSKMFPVERLLFSIYYSLFKGDRFSIIPFKIAIKILKSF